MQETRGQVVASFRRQCGLDEPSAVHCLDQAKWDLDRAVAMFLPPSPMSGRSFASSNFKKAYNNAAASEGPKDLGAITIQAITV